MSLKIYCGSRIENLAEKLKECLLKDRQGQDPFVFTKVVVPNGNLAKWLQIRMFAKEPDLCAGICCPQSSNNRAVRAHCGTCVDLV